MDRKTLRFQPFLAREQKGFCPRFCPRRKTQKTRMVRSFAGKRALSEEAFLFAPPHGDLLFTHHPPGRWLTRREGRCGKVPARPRGKGVHAGYGKRWIETLKAAIGIIPNPLQAPPCAAEGGAVQL